MDGVGTDRLVADVDARTRLVVTTSIDPDDAVGNVTYGSINPARIA